MKAKQTQRSLAPRRPHIGESIGGHRVKMPNAAFDVGPSGPRNVTKKGPRLVMRQDNTPYTDDFATNIIHPAATRSTNPLIAGNNANNFGEPLKRRKDSHF